MLWLCVVLMRSPMLLPAAEGAAGPLGLRVGGGDGGGDVAANILRCVLLLLVHSLHAKWFACHAALRCVEWRGAVVGWSGVGWGGRRPAPQPQACVGSGSQTGVVYHPAMACMQPHATGRAICIEFHVMLQSVGTIRASPATRRMAVPSSSSSRRVRGHMVLTICCSSRHSTPCEWLHECTRHGTCTRRCPLAAAARACLPSKTARAPLQQQLLVARAHTHIHALTRTTTPALCSLGNMRMRMRRVPLLQGAVPAGGHAGRGVGRQPAAAGVMGAGGRGPAAGAGRDLDPSALRPQVMDSGVRCTHWV